MTEYQEYLEISTSQAKDTLEESEELLERTI